MFEGYMLFLLSTYNKQKAIIPNQHTPKRKRFVVHADVFFVKSKEILFSGEKSAYLSVFEPCRS
jgi:hypothetical protein